MEDADFPAEIITIVSALRELLEPYTTMRLWDIDQVCASNPDPPAPITIEEIAAWTRFGGGVGQAPDPAFIQKVIDWATYNVFVQNCVCSAAQLPVSACWSLPSGTSSNVNGSIVAQTVLAIDQATFDSWGVELNGSKSGLGTYHMAAVSSGWNSADQFLDFQRPDGTWVAIVSMDIPVPGELGVTNASWPAGQHPTSLQIPMRIRHAAGPAGTFTDFRFCWEGRDATIPPLPVQPPITNLPAPPAFDCGPDTVCALLQDLARRLTTLGAQVSDIQASLTGIDALTEVSTRSITGEGEITLALGTRAVSLELNALPPGAFTSALGRPRGLMRVGSIRWGDGHGYSEREFIDADRYDRNRPAFAQTLSWQLLPGGTATLRELR
jgi:hypothetical protein